MNDTLRIVASEATVRWLCAPEDVSARRLRTTPMGSPSTVDRRAMTSWSSATSGSASTVSDVRFFTIATPSQSRMSPRGAGV